MTEPESPSPPRSSAPLEGMSPLDLLGVAMETASGDDDDDGGFEAPAPAEINGLFPSLEITELIGQGGMGAVYKATQLSLQRTVAVKVLPIGRRGSAQFEERFHREAQALAKLNHANIVTIYDFGQVKGLFYFVMEHVDGHSVAQLIRAGQMTPSRALRLVPRICDALEYAHAEGVVHRDIKPGNILVDRRGRVKVVDFGLAKLLDPRQGFDPSLTRASQVMGTPQYMAPEQLENPLSVDHRADIYSLGVVLYEMLTGKVPTGHFPRPSERAAVNPKLDDVILQALASEPAQRFQAVSDLHERLVEIERAVETLLAEKAQLAAVAAPLRMTPEAPRPPKELSWRWLAALGAVGALGLLAGLYLLGGWRALAAVALLGCLLAGFGCLLGWLRQRRAAHAREVFYERLVEPAQDPGEAARMEDLQRSFEQGLKTFRQYGKEPYDLPWFLVVGEPGAGKTEAIRHSSLRFPEGLQDRCQGLGGTIGMNWWFTNQAVILDTAGAMFLGEERGDRFGLFLRLLREHRPGCPINGLLLAIPADSLMLDDADATADKATRISRQISLIQSGLEARFPIFLVVTKCDKIPGFREFFDAERHGGVAKQMVGWSHAAPLDTPPTPRDLEQGLADLAERWRRRRWAILDAAGEQAQSRPDAVDALYGFPASFGDALPGLRRYLEVLFAADEWHRRPPFFRGVYFTSSLREGAALDQDLAKALGVSPERLPERGVWKRESAFFLRDLFVEKIFREQGLVTALRDTTAFFRRQLASLYGGATAGLALLAGAFWLASGSLAKEHERQDYLWKAINQEWQNGAFAPLIEPAPNGGPWRLSQRTIEVAGRPQSVESYLAELIDTGSTARWLPGDWGRQAAREARLIVLEGCLVKPLLDAAREKIQSGAGPLSAKEQAALAALESLETQNATTETLAALADYVGDGQIRASVFKLLEREPHWTWWRRPWVRSEESRQAIEVARRRAGRVR